MPLSKLQKGLEAVVTVSNVQNKTKNFLEGLGIIPGTKLSVISSSSGNLIVSVKGTRLAIEKTLAQQILVKEIPTEVVYEPVLV